MNKIMIVSIVVLFSLMAKAQNASPDAIQQTQNMLKNQSQRDELVKKDPQSIQADKMVQQLTGNNQGTTKEVYDLAAEVFKMIADKAGNDPTKMQDDINRFSRDPAGFAETWPPAQQQKLKELSHKLKMP